MDLELKDLKDAEVFNLMNDMVYITDLESHEILFANDAVHRFLGSPKNLLGMTCSVLTLGEERHCGRCPAETLGAMRETRCYNPLLKRFIYAKTRIISLGGKPVQLVVSFDVSNIEQEKQELATALQAQEVLVSSIRLLHETTDINHAYDLILKNIGEDLSADRTYTFILKKGLFYNTHEWCAQGIESRKEARCVVAPQLIKRWLPIFKENKCVVLEDISALRSTHPEEYDLLHAQNIRTYIAAPIHHHDKVAGFIGVDNPPLEKMKNIAPLLLSLAYYISARRVMLEHTAMLESMSYQDRMTGAGNRNAFIRTTEQLERSFSGHSIGIAYFDLNGLKEINDTHGHKYGDKAIIAFARLLHDTFPPEAIFRIGGDEFVVLCIDESEAHLKEKISHIKENLRKNSPFSVSIGVAWENKPKSIRALIEQADQRMYTEKESFHKFGK